MSPRSASTLLFLAACHRTHTPVQGQPEAPDSETGVETGALDTGTPAPTAPLLRADDRVALPFATAGEDVGARVLQIWNDGETAFTRDLQLTLTGDFAAEGDLSPLPAGATRDLTVTYTGPTDAPVIATGALTITADDQALAVPLAAVLGDPDLPDATWTQDAWGWRTTVALPSAPFPYGGAGSDDASVLIAIPAAFSDPLGPGVVTHLHGHNAVLASVVAAQYLVEQHSLSGRDALLVVPQGPENAADSDFGRLDTDGGHAALVRDALSVAYRDGYVSAPSTGPQVLTSHSGGYLCASYILQQGGLPIDAVHLYDSLYGEEDVYQDHAASGAVFRSIYTSTGGTDDNNRALAADLADAGYVVGEDFDDDALAAGDLSIGPSDASHSGTVWYGRAYARWLAESGLSRSPLAAPELRLVQSDGSQATVAWRADRAPGGRVRVEGSDDAATWEVLAWVDDPAGSGLHSATVAPRAYLRVRGEGDAASDVYGGTGGDVLVVDGFDRVFGGSWTQPTQDFAARLGRATGLPFSVASDEAVAAGDVALDDYKRVLWFLGDDSLADATLDDAAQARLSAYVAGGGDLIVSGSELGYATDATFLREVLGATYVSDDAGTDQAGDYTFGVIYEEDYPDVLSGETTLLSYATGGAAAVGADHQVIAVGFALETLEDDALADLLGSWLIWLDEA